MLLVVNTAPSLEWALAEVGGVGCQSYLHSSADKLVKISLPSPSPQVCSSPKTKAKEGLGTARGCTHQPQIRWFVHVACHIRQCDSFL